jgi:1,4-dihydroxy-2-naphthoate octaprenyltransferase
MHSRVLLWIRAARVPFFTGSVMPVCVCSAMAWHETGRFSWGYWLLTVVSMMLIHAGANLANDYFDHLSGNDPANTEFVNPFTGGSRVIQDLEVWPLDVLWAALLCLGAGSLLGLYLVYARGLWILAIGLVGVISAFCYSGPPLRLGYRGVGELFIFLDFGILPALGAYYVQAQTFSWGAIAAGLPNALLITAVLFINQFQDMRADMVADKRHWVVRLGRKRARWYYYALVTAAPLCVIGGVVLGWLPPTAMIGVGGGVLLPGMIWTAARYYDAPAELAPANASTIAMHLLTGVLLTVGVLLGGTA